MDSVTDLIEPVKIPEKPQCAIYEKLLQHYSIGSEGYDPNAQWLVKGIFQAGVSAIIGRPSSLKSFLSVDIACCVQTGRDWRGHKVDPGDVVYIAGEGANGVKKRILGWGLENGEAPRIHVISCGVKPHEVDVLIKFMRDKVGTPKLIIIDTLNRSFGGGDESGSGEMGTFLDGCSSIIQAFESSNVLVVHHTGKDETRGARGHSSFEGALDSAVLCSKQGSKDNLIMTLKHDKPPKDAEEMDPVSMSMREIKLGLYDEDGEEQKTLVLGHDTASPANNLTVNEMFEQAVQSVVSRSGGGFYARPLVLDQFLHLYMKGNKKTRESGRKAFNKEIKKYNVETAENDMIRVGQKHSNG